MSERSSNTPGRWATQQEAAQELGISTEAVRMRVRRGSLDSSKDDQGRVLVWAVSDRTQTAQETAQQPGGLVEALEARIESLERSLEHERESSRRKDHIIAGLVQRVPELEAAPDQPPQQEASQPSEETPSAPTDNEPVEGSGDTPRNLAARLRRWWRG